jgi:hypothetical protein
MNEYRFEAKDIAKESIIVAHSLVLNIIDYLDAPEWDLHLGWFTPFVFPVIQEIWFC